MHMGKQIRALLTLNAIAVLAFGLYSGSATALGVGESAPAFTAPSLTSNSNVKLSAYRGKVVLVDFWASWCPPCRESLPQFENLRQELAGSPFEVVAINVDENPDDGRQFLSTHPVTYPVVMDKDGKIPEKYEVPGMPTSYLLDKNGVVQYVHVAFKDGDLEKIKAEIQKLLAQ